MKFRLLTAVLIVQTLGAVPLEYNNSNWYAGPDPNLYGLRENFLIQGITLNAVQDANGFTGELQAVLRFNFGGTLPPVGNVPSLAPYVITSGGVVSTLYASDLFFRQNGVLQYGIPLVTHGGGGTINGRTVGASVFDSGDLYYLANGIQTLTSDQFLTAGTDPNRFGSGRTVWMTGSQPNPSALQSGTTQFYFNGACTQSVCPQAEYTVTLNLNGAPVAGSDWYLFLAGISDGSITPYFTGATCGNDLLDGTIPEPSTWLLLGCGLGTLAVRARRRN